MKTYVRIAILFAVVGALALVVQAARLAAAPQSSIIAKGRDKLFSSRDADRMKTDGAYAHEIEQKLQILDYRIAMALNSENKPDEAIAILSRLIAHEAAREQKGVRRSSQSYMHEAHWYEALQVSYGLKRDDAGAAKAKDQRFKLMMRAGEARKIEHRGEGRHVGQAAD